MGRGCEVLAYRTAQSAGSHAVNDLQEAVSIAQTVIEYLREIVEGLVDPHSAQVALPGSAGDCFVVRLRSLEANLFSRRW